MNPTTAQTPINASTFSNLGLTPDQINTLVGGVTNPTASTNGQFQPVAFDPNQFTPPDLQGLMTSAWNTLAPYYSQLLTEAQGDVNRAIQNLETDYQTGVRQTTTQAQTDIQNTLDTLTGSLQQTAPGNQSDVNNLVDTLNKRGIALTQGANGKLDVAGGGQAATQMSNLTSQQALRNEALNRSAQQTIGTTQQTAGNTLTNLANTQQQNIETQTRGLQQTEEGLNTQRQQEALGMATAQQQSQEQAAQDAQNAKELSAQNGTGSSFPSLPGAGGDAGARALGYADLSAYNNAKAAAGA